MRDLRWVGAALAACTVLVSSCDGDGSTGSGPASSSSTPTATLAPAAFEDGDCPFYVPDGYESRCGLLVVPENRKEPGGRPIRLQVVVVKGRGTSVQAEPVVYLDGGPGGNTIASLRYTLPAFEPFLEGHDFVFFDQRGVGSSSPSLECQGLRPLFYSVLGENLSAEEYRRRILEEAEDCREDLLARGADLRAYNSAENAADVEDLRRLLGYETWNLFGISYGTRLALTVMRDYPNGLRSVVLDSVYPLQVNLFTEGLDNVARVLRLLFDSCSADPACAAAYPDLESVFYQEADALERQPVDVPLRDPLSARYQLVQFDGEALLDTVVRGLHAAPVIPLLPRLIYDVRRGNFELAALIESTTLSESDLLSIGAYLSIECNDEAPFSRVKDASASVARHPELTRYGPAQDATLVLDVCRAWMGTDTPVDPLGNTPVVSAVPTLIFAGGYDPVTPPAWAQAAADGLENGHYVKFPDAGHGVALSSPCSAGIVVRFWEDPAAAPDSSCVSSTGPTFAGRSR